MLAKTWTTFVCAALTLGVAGCGATDEDGDTPKAFATYNAGLAPGFEDYADERTPQVIEQLAKEAKQLDVLCVQEFWREDDFVALSGALKTELPAALRPPPKPGTTTGSCAPEEVEPLRTCGKAHCDGLTGDSLQTCVGDKCLSLLPAGNCLSCLIGELGKGKVIDDIADACSGTGTVDPNADPAIFGGSYDIGLLTRLPVLEQSHCELPAYLVRVAAQYARVERDGVELNVFCTHLTSEIGDLPYAGKYQDFKDENLVEVDELLKCIADKSQGGPVVLLGDLNIGPTEPPALKEQWLSHFEKLTASGLEDVAAGHEPPLCTLDPENTFRADDSSCKRVDHILVRDVALTHAETFMTAPVTLSVGGSEVVSNLSDHYGLEAY